MFIYKIVNRINNKVYIGQTSKDINKRFYEHCMPSSKSTAICKAIQKYGKKNFTIEEIGGANSQTELNYLEWLMIIKNNTLAPHGYNLVEGGWCAGKMSNEVKTKISKANKGRQHTKKSRINMSLGSLGQKGGMSNKCHTELSKEKNSISNGGKYFLVFRKNTIIWEGINKSQCSRDLNLNSVGNITECLNGNRKQYKGYMFLYKKDNNG